MYNGLAVTSCKLQPHVLETCCSMHCARNLLQNRVGFFDQVGLLFGGGTYAGQLRVYGADVVEWLVELWPKLWPDWRLASAGDGGGLVAEQPRG